MGRSCAGISGRSQILFCIVFTSRYLDLITNFISVYNTTMKLFFLGASFGTVYLMYLKFKATYDTNHDTFRVEFLLGPTAVLALVLNHEFTFMEILWTFSIYLESVAILPQLFMVQKTGEAESITSHYLLPWVHTEDSIFSTGSTDTISRASMISSRSLPELFKRFCTPTSFISTSPRF